MAFCTKKVPEAHRLVADESIPQVGMYESYMP